MARRVVSFLKQGHRLTYLALGLVLLTSLAFRLYGINWDQGFDWTPHPDERAILMKVGDLSLPDSPGQFLNAKESPLNPHWFPYGSFPLYLLKLFTLPFGDTDPRLLGRALSALFDLGTVLLVFLLGARLYSRRVGLLGAAFAAVAVLHIQLSHFYTVDTILTFFILLCLYFLAGAYRRGDRGSSLGAGVALGLALATKVSAAPLFLPVVAAYVLFFLASPGRQRVFRAATGLLLTLAISGITFLLAEPYALLDLKTFLDHTLEQSGMVRGTRDLPFTRQYLGTTAYLYPIQQLATWGLGLPLGIVSWAGFLFFAVRGLRRRQAADLFLLAWVLPYFLLVGGFQVKYLRYLLPLTPVLFLMAADLLLAWRGRSGGRWLRPATLVIGLVLFASLFYSIAYVRIYARPHPGVEAAQWIKAHVPDNSVLLKEHWEEALPGLEKYQHPELALYDADNQAKVEHIAQRLQRADYLVLFSNRLYGTIPRLPERYPVTRQYYYSLFSGELGFELAYYTTSYPNLFGMTLVDDTFRRPGLPQPEPLAGYSPPGLALNLGYADESFTVYDHPKVMIFKKEERLSEAEIKTVLEGKKTPAPHKGILSPVDAEENQAGGTWSELSPRQSLPNRIPALAWILLIEGVSLLAFPIAFVLFRSLPDRGYLLAKPLGLLLIAFPPWIMSSFHFLPFSRRGILLGLVALALLSLWIAVSRWKEIREFLRRHWKVLLMGEALFIAAFLLFLMIRLLNPDLWHPFRGGEKPMDFAYLNAVIKSSYMPPYDPWFSGGYLNYYYYGQFLLAVPIKLLGIVPSVAFNLAVPLLFALTAAAAFSVVYNLVRSRRQDSNNRAALWAGLAAAAFVVLIGNLDGIVQVVKEGNGFSDFDYWRSSRMFSPSFAITEFPFFTFLFADLHAHLIALPFTLLATGMALALALAGSPRTPLQGEVSYQPPWTEHLQDLPLLAALALALGALWATNSWDFPTYFLLSGGALLAAEYNRRRRLGIGLFLWPALKLGLLLLLTGLLYYPYFQTSRVAYLPRWGSAETTSLLRYAGVHGLFLFLISSYLVLRLVLDTGARESRRFTIGYILGAGAIVIAFAALRMEAMAFILSLIALVLFIAMREIRQAPPGLGARLFPLMLAALALSLTAGVDLTTLKGDIARMNTVFKFYLQAWVLFALSSAFALGWVLREFATRRGAWPWKGFWLGILALLLFSTLIYPVMATPVRLRDRFQPLPPTLDGMEYMRQAIYFDQKGQIELRWDYEALRWMQDNVKGSPVILEGNTPLYRWGSRVSIYTGLPTVAGWDWHQKQQRAGYEVEVEKRLWAVQTMYSDPDPRLADELIREYGVRYIYLGQLERLYYPEEGLAKFERMVGETLEIAYQNPGVKIYRVRG